MVILNFWIRLPSNQSDPKIQFFKKSQSKSNPNIVRIRSELLIRIELDWILDFIRITFTPSRDAQDKARASSCFFLLCVILYLCHGFFLGSTVHSSPRYTNRSNSSLNYNQKPKSLKPQNPNYFSLTRVLLSLLLCALVVSAMPPCCRCRCFDFPLLVAFSLTRVLSSSISLLLLLFLVFVLVFVLSMRVAVVAAILLPMWSCWCCH